MGSMDPRLQSLLDHQEIADVCRRYCRGIDRRQFNIVRNCYHPDGTDDHGDYRGGIDGFIEHVTVETAKWERTLHFLGNILIEVEGDRARAETYALAFHRRAARADRPARDFTAAIRYIDDFERRAGEWRIFTRVCVVEWTRTDPVGAGGWIPTAAYAIGRRDEHDVVFAERLPRPDESGDGPITGEPPPRR